MNTILPFLSMLFNVTSAVLVAFGWYFIRSGQQQKHIRVMVSAAVSATVFFIFYALRTLLVGNTEISQQAPEIVRTVYFVFLLFHIVLATVGGALGIVSLYLGYKKKFDTHKKIGPWTASIWTTTGVTGLTVYILLYVIYPGGATKPVIDAIFGS